MKMKGSRDMGVSRKDCTGWKWGLICIALATAAAGCSAPAASQKKVAVDKTKTCYTAEEISELRKEATAEVEKEESSGILGGFTGRMVRMGLNRVTGGTGGELARGAKDVDVVRNTGQQTLNAATANECPPGYTP